LHVFRLFSIPMVRSRLSERCASHVAARLSRTNQKLPSSRRTRGGVNKMNLRAEIPFSAIIAKAHPHRARVGLGNFGRAVTKALRPEIRRLVTTARNRPVLHDRLPILFTIDRILDLIFDLGRWRIAGCDVGRSMDCRNWSVDAVCKFQGDTSAY
jgi:hypothetical protein